jgi:hypothetical protein
VRLLELGQKPATQLALELGVARNKIYQWQEQAKVGVRSRSRNDSVARSRLSKMR